MSTNIDRTVSASIIPEAFGYPIGLVFAAVSADSIRFEVSISFRVRDIESCLDMRAECVKCCTTAFSSKLMAEILADVKIANWPFMEATGTLITDFEITIGDPIAALKHQAKRGWKRFIPFL